MNITVIASSWILVDSARRLRTEAEADVSDFETPYRFDCSEA